MAAVIPVLGWKPAQSETNGYSSCFFKSIPWPTIRNIGPSLSHDVRRGMRTEWCWVHLPLISQPGFVVPWLPMKPLYNVYLNRLVHFQHLEDLECGKPKNISKTTNASFLLNISSVSLGYKSSTMRGARPGPPGDVCWFSKTLLAIVIPRVMAIYRYNCLYMGLYILSFLECG